MSSQLTRSPSPIASFLHEHPDTLRMTRRREPLPPWGFWALVAAGLLLNFAILGIGANLFLNAGRTVEPPAQRRISVPYAEETDLLKSFHRWVVQEDGRNKPLDTFARESVRTITGRERFEGNDPVAVVLSWLLLFDNDDNRAILNARQAGCDWENYPFLLCDFHELRRLVYAEKFGEDEELTNEQLHGKFIEPAVLRDSKVFRKILQDSTAKRIEDAKAPLSQLERKAGDVEKRLDLYDRIRAGGQEGRERVHAAGAMGLVALDPHSPTWFSLRAVREFAKTPYIWDEMMQSRRIAHQHAYDGQPVQAVPTEAIKQIADAATALQIAYLAGDGTALLAAAETFHTTVETVSAGCSTYPGTTTTGLELWFNEKNPFRRAWVVSLLAAVLLLTSLATSARWPLVSGMFYLPGLFCYVAALFWSLTGFYCRVAISGRPPVSNMYESVIWVAFMTAVFGLLLECIYRRKVMALTGALVSAFGLLLADRLPLSLSPSIQPLVAVLRDNYWLTVHVLTIVSSYAAFALAWGLGNFNLAVMLFAPERKDLVRAMSHLCYRAIQIGVVLLAAGTLLGGFWAAESWGRFWGWDPKEVWALIALLCYVIPLHARQVGWVKDFGLAACSVVCFASVVMAWYGVNFVLGAGLHSYGFGGGNDAWVYWAALINLSVVVHAALRFHHWHPATRPLAA